MLTTYIRNDANRDVCDSRVSSGMQYGYPGFTSGFDIQSRPIEVHVRQMYVNLS